MGDRDFGIMNFKGLVGKFKSFRLGGTVGACAYMDYSVEKFEKSRTLLLHYGFLET